MVITNRSEELERFRREMEEQRRRGVKVKLDFDSPQWWTAEFIKQAERLAAPKDLPVAKMMAKEGRVSDVKISPGVIEARAHSPGSPPCGVRLYSGVPTEEQTHEIKRRLAVSAICGAQLLAGEMPEEMREIFRLCGVGLVPQDFGKSRLLCSCPSPNDICVHIIATILVAAGAFDRDPFLLLKMRGFTKDELLDCLTEPREPDANKADIEAFPPREAAPAETGQHSSASYLFAEDAAADMTEHTPAEMVALARAHYATRGPARLTEAHTGDMPDRSARAPLFDFPLWRGETSFSESMQPYYDCVRLMMRQ